MLHLAQVQKNEFSGGVELRLLAHEQYENSWVVLTTEEIVPIADTHSLSVGLFVLVELSPELEVVRIEDAKQWILHLVQLYLGSGMTPAFLQQETERAEQERQNLTLQNQELARKTIEMEARHEQIQALEEDLKREKQQLELMVAQLKAKNDSDSGSAP